MCVHASSSIFFPPPEAWAACQMTYINFLLRHSFSRVDNLLLSFQNVEVGRFGVDMTTDSVIHLVGELDANSNGSVQPVSENIQTLCVANIETVAEVKYLYYIYSTS